MTKHKYPQSEALELARLNAIRLLGLHEHNTPEERAKAMGYTGEGFHGTAADISEINPTHAGATDYGTIGQGFYIDPSKNAAYSNLVNRLLEVKRPGQPRRIMPVRYKPEGLFDATDLGAIRDLESSKRTTKALQEAGHSGTFSRQHGSDEVNEVAMFNPAHVRSRFAAFDPARAHEAGLSYADGGSTTELDAMKLALMNKAKLLEDSKVKKRVYHGTKSHDDYADNEGEAIRQFTGLANWTAEEPYTSNGYAGGTGYSMPLHIKLKKPLRLGFDLNGHVENALKAAKRLGVNTSIYSDDMEPHHVVNSPEFIEAAIRKGYDGMSAKESGRMTHAVFDPRHIKSAIGNRGTYDTTDPDITKAKGGTVKDYITITERPL